jgi:Na+/proline symporter
MQRVLATKSPKEAAKMNWFVNVVLIFPRYTLITGITVFALVRFSPELRAMGSGIDVEVILPYIIKNVLPVGVVGLLLSGLIAAFMSNYAATINAAPAYVVNDIYKRFINPHAEERVYVRLSIITTVAFVIVGFAFGFMVESINQVTLWIVSALYGGYTASNILKWYWWRLNGHGYFWGMMSGIGASMIIPEVFPSLSGIMAFPPVLGVSLVGCRPWGFWNPVLKKVRAYYPEFNPNPYFKRDIMNLFIGVTWQVSLVLLPISLVTQEFEHLLWVVPILLVTSIVLKFTWWNKLDEMSRSTLPDDFEQRVGAAESPINAVAYSK